MNRFHRWYCRSDRWARTVESRLLPWALRGLDLGDEVLELGPGPGLTTDVLRQQVARLTVAEVDAATAAVLRDRLGGTNVTVEQADATTTPFAGACFSAVVCFTMLHHVPSAGLQDALFREAFRVLRPGGVFAGSDSTASLMFRLAHLFDTMTLVDPASLAGRLHRAGFEAVDVRTGKGAVRFRGRKHAGHPATTV